MRSDNDNSRDYGQSLGHNAPPPERLYKEQLDDYRARWAELQNRPLAEILDEASILAAVVKKTAKAAKTEQDGEIAPLKTRQDAIKARYSAPIRDLTALSAEIVVVLEEEKARARALAEREAAAKRAELEAQRAKLEDAAAALNVSEADTKILEEVFAKTQELDAREKAIVKEESAAKRTGAKHAGLTYRKQKEIIIDAPEQVFAFFAAHNESAAWRETILPALAKAAKAAISVGFEVPDARVSVSERIALR